MSYWHFILVKNNDLLFCVEFLLHSVLPLRVVTESCRFHLRSYIIVRLFHGNLTNCAALTTMCSWYIIKLRYFSFYRRRQTRVNSCVIFRSLSFPVIFNVVLWTRCSHELTEVGLAIIEETPHHLRTAYNNTQVLSPVIPCSIHLAPLSSSQRLSEQRYLLKTRILETSSTPPAEILRVGLFQSSAEGGFCETSIIRSCFYLEPPWLFSDFFHRCLSTINLAVPIN